MTNELKLTGTYKGATNVQKISEKFSKRLISLDTGATVNPMVVFELTRTSVRDNTDMADNYTPGDMITVFFDIRCNQHGGRWYTNLTAWKIEKAATYTDGTDFPPVEADPFKDFA